MSSTLNEHIIFGEKVKVPFYPKERFQFLLNRVSKGLKEKIFYFCGEPFLCEEAAKEIVKIFKKNKSLTCECINGEEIEEKFLEERLINT
ncbi:MAG TPA: hypothetical protein ENF30_01820, partial [Candidatus Desulfofervidus auxilii]|nr:hypothetical protein [Candidatus Desulfofervidus auxilii]